MQQRRDRGLHGGVGTSRPIQPRIQLHRYVRRDARRGSLSGADPQNGAQADPRFPAGRVERYVEPAVRQLVQREPRYGGGAQLCRLRSGTCVGRRRSRRRAGHGDFPGRDPLAVARLAESGRRGAVRQRYAAQHTDPWGNVGFDRFVVSFGEGRGCRPAGRCLFQRFAFPERLPFGFGGDGCAFCCGRRSLRRFGGSEGRTIIGFRQR